MDGQMSLPPILDDRGFDSLVPDGLFYRTESSQEYQFMLRYITRLLSLVDHSDEGLLLASDNPIECHFVQLNQLMPSSSSRMQADARFIAELTMRCCFSITTVLGALEYMLLLHSKGVVRLHSTSWKTIFVVCCLLSEKMWEDNYVHPSHIISQYGYLAKGGSNVPKRDDLALQLLLVNSINWQTNITLDRYRELVSNIMGVSVPSAILRTLPAGYAGCVPRPLPALPRMNLPTQRARAGSADSVGYYKLSSVASTTTVAGSYNASPF